MTKDDVAFWALILQTLAFCGLLLQLWSTQRTMRFTALVQRRELYVNLTQTLPEEMIDTMMLHRFDHFDARVFDEHYAASALRTKSYLLMKRKYFYLVLVTAGDMPRARAMTNGADQWVAELCAFHEFHHVHAFHAHYYVEFARRIAPSIQAFPPERRRWAVNDEAAAPLSVA